MKTGRAESLTVTGVVWAAALLAGCATSTSQIKAERVSPLEYETYSREQIAGDAEKVAR
jgi:hypothetical protein